MDLHLGASLEGYSEYIPESIEVTAVCSGDIDMPEKLQIYHPWTFAKVWKVCAGPAYIHTKTSILATLFTFGGTIAIQTSSDSTNCTLQSTAPILKLDKKMNDIAKILADEARGLLATRRAAWLPDLETYCLRLQMVEPFLLYITILDELSQKFGEFPVNEMPHLEDFCIFLESTIGMLKRKNRWPNQVPGLSNLL